MTDKVLGYHDYLKKALHRIYVVATILIIVGNILDILPLHLAKDSNLALNSASIIISITLYILYQSKYIKIQTAFAIITYTVIINSFLSLYLGVSDDVLTNLFLRDIFFVMLLLILAAFVSNRKHALIIGSLSVIQYIVLSYYTKEPFLIDSLHIILIICISYSIVIYYFVGVLNRTIENLQEGNIVITQQNTNLNEVNTLLEERQQQIEEQRKFLESQNDELEKNSKEKNMFFSVISHDLKDPFNLLINYSDILISRFERIPDDKKISYIKNINSVSHNTYELLSNLLDWSKSQSGKMDFKPTEVLLEHATDSVYSMIHTTIEMKEIQLSREFSLDMKVLADKNMLETIIRNLLLNAVKYTPRGGKVIIKAEELNEQFTKILICDKGVGIPPDANKYLFNITNKYSTEGTENEPGTGLGLILCKEFVARHNGEIGYYNNPDKGATFWFTVGNVLNKH